MPPEGLPQRDNGTAALCRVSTARNRLLGVGSREFDHHGEPLCDVVQPRVGDLGHLAQPVAHGVLVHSSLQANGYKVILTKLRTAPLDQCTVTAVRPGATGDWAAHHVRQPAPCRTTPFNAATLFWSAAKPFLPQSKRSRTQRWNVRETASRPKSRADDRGRGRRRATGARPGGCVGRGVVTDGLVIGRMIGSPRVTVIDCPWWAVSSGSPACSV